MTQIGNIWISPILHAYFKVTIQYGRPKTTPCGLPSRRGRVQKQNITQLNETHPRLEAFTTHPKLEAFTSHYAADISGRFYTAPHNYIPSTNQLFSVQVRTEPVITSLKYYHRLLKVRHQKTGTIPTTQHTQKLNRQCWVAAFPQCRLYINTLWQEITVIKLQPDTTRLSRQQTNECRDMLEQQQAYDKRH